MKPLRFRLLMITAAIFASVTRAMPAPPSTAASSDDQQIRDAALAVLDVRRAWDAKVLDTIVLESELERLFASEMLRAMRAEQGMFRRAAVAVSGSDDSDAVRKVDQAAVASATAIGEAQISIDGDSATMPVAPSGGRGTTLTFRRVEGGWQIDFLRRYRERKQIDIAGIAKWKGRQQAAEEVARIYERKEERDLSVLPLLYETMSKNLAKAAAKQVHSNPTTKPND